MKCNVCGRNWEEYEGKTGHCLACKPAAAVARNCPKCNRWLFLEEGEVCPICAPYPEPAVQYVIKSGWEENPIWYCEVRFDKGLAGVEAHLHTTREAGESPSVVEAKCCGLMFLAHGWHPIEARKGRLTDAYGRYLQPHEAINIITA